MGTRIPHGFRGEQGFPAFSPPLHLRRANLLAKLNFGFVYVQ